MKKLKYFLLTYLSFLPGLALAQGVNESGILKIFTIFQGLLDRGVYILIAIAILYFFWGVIQYVIKADPDEKAKGRTTMIYGIIGIAVMLSVWGLVALLQNTFLTDKDTAPPTPKLPIVKP